MPTSLLSLSEINRANSDLTVWPLLCTSSSSTGSSDTAAHVISGGSFRGTNVITSESDPYTSTEDEIFLKALLSVSLKRSATNIVIFLVNDP